MATADPSTFSGPPPAYGQAPNQVPVNYQQVPGNYQPPPVNYQQAPANYQQVPPGYQQAAANNQAAPASSTNVKPQVKTYTISRASNSSKKHLTLALESTDQPIYAVDSGKRMTLHPTLIMKSFASGLSITAEGAPLTSHIDLYSTATKAYPAHKSEFYHEHGAGGNTHAFTHPVNNRLYYWKRTHDPALTSRPGDGFRQDTAGGHLKCVDARTHEVVAAYVAKGWATGKYNFGRYDLYLSPGKDSEEWEAWLLFAGVLLEEKTRDEESSSSSAAASGGGGC